MSISVTSDMEFKDLEISLMEEYHKKTKQIKDIFDRIDFNPDSKLKKALEVGATLIMENDIVSVDRSNILCARGKQLLENIVESNFTNKIQLIHMELDNLKTLCSTKLKQFENDIYHHEKNVNVLDISAEDIENFQENQEILDENDDFNQVKQVMKLKNEVVEKKRALEELRKELSVYEGLPPDLNLAKKMLSDNKIKLDALNNQIYLISKSSP